MSRKVLNPASVFDAVAFGYSQGAVVAAARRVLVSGQAGVDTGVRTHSPGLQDQAEAALDNVERVLADAGCGLAQVVFLRLYVCDTVRDDLQGVANVLRRRFPDNPPPASWVIVSGLAMPEWLVLIEAEAALD